MNKTTRNEMAAFRSRTAFKTILLTMACLVVVAGFSLCFAEGPNYAENGVKWFLDQAFWVIIGIIVWGSIKLFAARAYTPLVILVIVGGLIGGLTKAPTQMAEIGGKLLSIVTGG